MSTRRPRAARPEAAAVLALAACVWTCPFANCPSVSAAPLGDQERARVEELIEQLGDESYARRMEAQQRLRLYGVEVLDALRQADDHPDPQVARTAAYLLRSSNVVWSSDGDSPRVRKLLRSYESDSFIDRSTTIEQLAKLPDDEGVPALARVARYEFSGDLARRAAVELLQMDQAGREAAQLRSRWQGVLDTIQDSQTRPCQWLRQAAQMYRDALDAPPGGQDPTALTEGLALPEVPRGSGFRMPPSGLIDAFSRALILRPESFDDAWWAAQVDAEQELLDASPGETSRYVLEELCRFRAETLVWCGRRADAVRAAARELTLPKLDGDLRGDEETMVTRAIDFAMPEFALELLESRLADPQPFPLFIYRAAEAHSWLGDEQKAKQLAQRAFEANSGSNLRDRYGYGRTLAARGLYDWAEREYRGGVESIEHWDLNAAVLVMNFYHLLQDKSDHAAVAELLEEFGGQLEADAVLRQDVENLLSLTPSYLRSVRLHSLGKVAVTAGQVEDAKANWREAIALSPENVDVVIDMYRLDGDEAWRREVAETVERVAATSWQDVQDKEVYTRDPNRAAQDGRSDYANALNTHAWLLANVEGDKRQALRLSLQSNQLAPYCAAYYDTLAKCYHALGDFESAAHWQFRAWKLEPHQRQLLTTWLEYRKELGRSSP